MPLLTIETNQSAAGEQRQQLLKAASTLVAELLHKPEQYVMVRYTHNPHMLFAGDTQPLAYLELKSIDLAESTSPELSAALCKLMETQLGIAKNRTYIEFANAPRHMWGWNAGTF